MASADQSVDDIRRQMAEIRSQLHHDMTRVVGEATSVTDWRSYVRERPWLFLGGAFAMGYVLVPRRTRPDTPAPMAVVDLGPRQTPERPRQPLFWRAIKTVGGLVVPVAFRAAQGYALRWVEDYLVNHPPGPMVGGMMPDPSQGRGREPAGGAERFGYTARG